MAQSIPAYNLPNGSFLYPVGSSSLGLAFPRKAKRFSEEQSKIILDSPPRWQWVMLDDRGLVKSNFAAVQYAKAQSGSIGIVYFSEMTEAQVADYVRCLKQAAKECGWPAEMLDIELQFLGDYR